MLDLTDPVTTQAHRAPQRRASPASAALGLCVLLASAAVHAQTPPPAQAAPSAPAAQQPAPPPAQAAPSAPAAQQPLPPPPAPPQGYAPGTQAPPPGYGAPPQGYGAPPPGYGAPPQGYGAPPQGYGYPYYPYPYPYPYYGAPNAQPYSLPPAPPPTERKSTGMMIGGILLTTVGIGAVLVGSGLITTATNKIDVYCEGPSGPSVCEQRDDKTQAAAGWGLLVGGVVAIGAGVPLWIIGSKRVPVKTDSTSPTQSSPPSPAASVRLLVGPSSAAVHVRF
jgi:hypothetical protein